MGGGRSDSARAAKGALGAVAGVLLVCSGTVTTAGRAVADEPARPGATPAAPTPAPMPVPGGAATQGGAPEVEWIAFADAVARALARNPTAAVAAEEVRRADAIVLQARAASLPTLAATGTYTRLDSDRVLGGRVLSPADQVNAGLTLAVPLVAPSRWVQWSHARDAALVARTRAVEVRRQLAVGVARTCLALLAQHRVIEVAERALETARAHLDFADRRFRGGYGNRIDVVRAAAEVSADAARLDTARVQLTGLRESLGVLLGGERPLDVAGEPELPGAPPLALALQLAGSERADVRLDRERVASAERVVRDRWADYTPTLVGSFSPFLQAPATATLPAAGWQAQLALSWVLYDGGLRYGLDRERRALAREAELDLSGAVRQARSDARAADGEIRIAARALASAREAAGFAEEGVKLTGLAYQAGASTNIEVIDAERRARDAATDVAAAEDGLRQALLDAAIATGRFPSSR